MAHVVDAGRRFGGAIVQALDGQAPARPMTGPPDPGTERRPAEEWWQRLTADREALFARVLAADPGRHLEAAIEHPFFGPLTWRETLLFVRLHDLDHAGQLRKIAAAFA
jgi:hypothetical protein